MLPSPNDIAQYESFGQSGGATFLCLFTSFQLVGAEDFPKRGLKYSLFNQQCALIYQSEKITKDSEVVSLISP